MTDPTLAVEPPSDPFFALPEDSRWNACIGVQGSEENYVDGFMQAATELAGLIIDKRMIGQRDTLVLPILYNARHGLELALKYAINRLHGFGLFTEPAAKDHDIAAAYTRLAGAELGDAALRGHVQALARFVNSLSAIDEDGQELRYAETRHGDKSLLSLALANIEVIRTSLGTLNGILDRLKYRLHDLEEERAGGTFTARCSRRDLYKIAARLPARGTWGEEAFDQVRADLKQEFALSSKQLSDALNVMQRQRELRQMIGLPVSLLHLTDEHVRLAAAHWSPLHPPRTPAQANDLGVSFEALDFRAFAQRREECGEAVEVLASALSAEEIADITAMYEIGRGGHMCEHYESMVAFWLDAHSRKRSPREPLDRLMHKTNFFTALVTALGRLGRYDLAQEIMALRPDLT